jgi:hypothetical protein
LRWYFAIDESGAKGELGDMAKLAVLSARAVGGLEPVLLYHGAPSAFTAWMERQRVRVVTARPSVWAAVEQARTGGPHNPHTIGHWLRVTIPQVETEQEYVLYTDCDVIFLRRFAWESLRPKVFAAAPEFEPDDWRRFNSGVMVLSVPAMRATWPAFEAQIVARLADPEYPGYNDQFALNECYAGHWERLPALCNHKPYWPFDPQAAVLHFHGPKPRMVDALARRALADPGKAAQFFNRMLDARADCYVDWTRFLGDYLQAVDFDSALGFARLASALTAYRKTLPAMERPWPPC